MVDKKASQQNRNKYKSLIILLGVLTLLVSVICVVIWIPVILPDINLLSNFGGGGLDDAAGQNPNNCEELLGIAMDVSYQGCQLIGSNEICYGNNNVFAQLVPDSTDQFTFLGDVIPVGALEKLATSPMSLDENVWGIAVFRLAADLPGTVPGQNVTFLVVGDTNLNNPTGDMKAIYFSTGFGSVTCSKVPNGLFVDMPEGAGILFTANGVQLGLQGDAFLEAVAGEQMTITMIDGTGIVIADGVSEQVEGGNSVTVPLNQDLDPTGPPSDPVPVLDEDVAVLCLLLESDCPIDDDGPAAATFTSVPVDPNLPTNTPVPVDPNLPTNTPVPVDPNLPTNTPVPVPTNTSVPVPSGQPTNTPVPVPTNTAVPLPTNTSVPVPTNTPMPLPTNTPVPLPTNTPSLTPTNTSPPAATNTPVPPTATNTPLPPTATNTSPPPPTATNTAVPPTPTNTAAAGACSNIVLANFGVNPAFDTKQLLVDITNNYGTDIVLDQVTVSWPAGNGDLNSARLDTGLIWGTGEPAQPPPSAVLTLTSTVNKRTIATGSSKQLRIQFQNDVALSGHSLSVTFDVGCTRSVSN